MRFRLCAKPLPLGSKAQENQPRRRMVLPTGACLHQLAGAHRGYFGIKIYSTYPQHGAWFHFLLYDAGTARPLALIEWPIGWGKIRTGAATGLATDLLTDQLAPQAAPWRCAPLLKTNLFLPNWPILRLLARAGWGQPHIHRYT